MNNHDTEINASIIDTESIPCRSDKTASLPPKPIDNRNARRGGSVTRGENRYKIQF